MPWFSPFLPLVGTDPFGKGVSPAAAALQGQPEKTNYYNDLHKITESSARKYSHPFARRPGCTPPPD
jgi:hypothetical protein